MSDAHVIRGRKLLDDPRGFTVIIPMESDEPIPWDCPICGLLMGDPTDPYSYRKAGTCTDCYLRWVEPDRERWKTGWRPDRESVVNRTKERCAIPVNLRF